MGETHGTSPLLTERYRRALGLALELHDTQLRKGTEIPYFSHLISVSALVLEYGGDEDCAIAALLHDAVEDSPDGQAVESRIRREFGDGVGDIVMACTDAVGIPGSAKPPWRARKVAYLEHLRMETNNDALLVSACDKLHNARSIVSDLHRIGPELWQRFGTKSADDQLWYYSELVGSYPAGSIPAALRNDLARTVGEMRSLSAAPRVLD